MISSNDNKTQLLIDKNHYKLIVKMNFHWKIATAFLLFISIQANADLIRYELLMMQNEFLIDLMAFGFRTFTKNKQIERARKKRDAIQTLEMKFWRSSDCISMKMSSFDKMWNQIIRCSANNSCWTHFILFMTRHLNSFEFWLDLSQRIWQTLCIHSQRSRKTEWKSKDT